jgi:predicted transcriptional regulator with HTH domain
MFWPRAGLLGLFSREKKTRVKNWKLKVTKYKKTVKILKDTPQYFSTISRFLEKL